MCLSSATCHRHTDTLSLLSHMLSLHLEKVIQLRAKSVFQVLRYLQNRMLAHRNAINFCQNILKKKCVEWKAVFRTDLSKPIHDVDMVISVGGDGTLLQASHVMDDSIPILGVNSDPTQPKEVAEFSEEFDATRSTDYLCAATTSNFEQECKEESNLIKKC